MNERRIKELSELAYQVHAETNHKYADIYPYELHLRWVQSVARRFLHLQPINLHEDSIITAAWHDSIEDARQTFNDVRKATSDRVARSVMYLTNNWGFNRAERADDVYYERIRGDEIARYVKLCDRAANMEFGNIFGGKTDMYRKEMPDFLNKTGAYDFFPEIAAYLRSL